ncbi:MAG TPA: hypothetical protein PKA41_15850, partial [Verrucomicrobiota bacterium]|nr:hypothetical protein [Verrucomicrobiota bacterium]
PDSVSNRLDLANCALTFGDEQLATRTLRAIEPAHRNTAAFHQLAAMAAVASRELSLAEAHFTEAARLDPDNPTLQFNLAVIQLQATNTSTVAQAVQKLESLRNDPTHGHDALRHLVMAAIHGKDASHAVRLSRELVQSPACTLDDHLLRLGALLEAHDPGYTNSLAELQVSCATNAATVNALAAWLISRDLADDAARWLDNLPDGIKGERPVTLARADAYIAMRDWTEMQTALRAQKWDDVDFLRLAMLSRACREQNQDFAAQSEWLAAVQSVSARPRALAALATMAARWGWEKEQEDLLWTIVTKFPAERWALQSLDQIYTRASNTRGMHKVYSIVVNYNPDDIIAKNNLAAVSLLLNMPLPRAFELANEAYARQPSNASFASTLAFALHLQGKTADGVAILETLRPAQLDHPNVALYYGALLAAMDPPQKDKAQKYLDLAANGKLLPEEKALLDEARRKL